MEETHKEYPYLNKSLADMENEVWKNVTIAPYTDYYLVSNYGRFKKAHKVVTGKLNSQRTLLPKILVQSPDIKGYLRVHLLHNKERFSTSAGRLVALAFIENPENKPQVNHIDGDKNNNMVENLEWTTNGENGKHAYDHFLRRKKRGGSHHSSKLTDEQATDILVRAKQGEKIYRIWKKDFCNLVGYSVLKYLVKRKTYKNLPL